MRLPCYVFMPLLYLNNFKRQQHRKHSKKKKKHLWGSQAKFVEDVEEEANRKVWRRWRGVVYWSSTEKWGFSSCFCYIVIKSYSKVIIMRYCEVFSKSTAQRPWWQQQKPIFCFVKIYYRRLPFLYVIIYWILFFNNYL